MISFFHILDRNGDGQVEQRLVHPAVYLDTWAIRYFAEDDPVAGARFRAALTATGGTLVLSDMNLADFTGFDDAKHAHAAGRFIDSLAANLYFIEFNAFDVINREVGVMVRQTQESPAGDPDMLRIFAEDIAATGGRPCVQHWFAEMHRVRSRLKPGVTGLAKEFLRGLDALRLRFDTEVGFKKSARRDVANSTRPRSTQALLRAIFFRLQGDRMTKLTANDAIDVMHCIVPAAYCDFVLLDQSWCSRLASARAWLIDEGIESHVADCYAKPGVEKFLETLEAWQPPSVPGTAPGVGAGVATSSQPV